MVTGGVIVLSIKFVSQNLLTRTGPLIEILELWTLRPFFIVCHPVESFGEDDKINFIGILPVTLATRMDLSVRMEHR